MTLKSQWNLPQNGFYWGWLRYQMGSTELFTRCPLPCPGSRRRVEVKLLILMSWKLGFLSVLRSLDRTRPESFSLKVFELRSSLLLSVMSLCDLMDCNTPDFPVLHHLPEFA